MPSWIHVGFGTPGCLGNGLTATQSTPVFVSGSYNFTKVYTSGNADATRLHACGLLTSQAVVCWGTGANGQLGNGATSDSSTPVLVGGSLLFTDLSVGSTHTCGVDSTHNAWCWGESLNWLWCMCICSKLCAVKPADIRCLVHR